MAVNTVRVQINGTWIMLTKNATTGKYEGMIAAPPVTSFNVNAGHYYPVTAEATDLAGNVTTKNDTDPTLGSYAKLYTKEITVPTIAFTAPAAGAYLATNTPAISFQLRDETNGSGIKISTLTTSVDGGAALTNVSSGVVVTQITGGYNVTYTPQTALSDGNHTVVVNIQDNDGNAAVAASRSFKVDTVPPVLNITTPAEATTYRNNASITIVGSTNDAISSPVTVTVKLNSGATEAVTVDAGGNFSKSLALVEGSNTITVEATDLAGKKSSVTRMVILDTVPPVITSITISPNPVNVGQSYMITVEVTD
jgi:hypothetical protein